MRKNFRSYILIFVNLFFIYTFKFKFLHPQNCEVFLTVYPWFSIPSILNITLLDQYLELTVYLKRLGKHNEKSSRVPEESTLRNSQRNFEDLLYHIPIT
jgi:hypothetical protein